MSSKVYVVDTNIILNSLNNLFRLSQNGANIIVIPETVLIELEEKKKEIGEIGYQAREFARLLARAKMKESSHKDGYKVAKLLIDSLVIHIFSIDRYESDVDQRYINESNDKRIIEVALVAQKYYRGLKVSFISLDVYARTFAYLKNVATETLRDDKDEVPEFGKIKTIELDESVALEALKNAPIIEYDKEYRSGDFNYKFIEKDGKISYAIVVNGHIDPLKETEFKGIKVKPVNVEQKLYMKAILCDFYDIVVVDAKAGTGKTLLAFSSAMRLIEKSRYDKIIYVRNSIESLDKGADVGYLAGNDEKFRVYNMALNDTLEHIAKKMLKKSKSIDSVNAVENKILELISKYRIEKLWPGEARGRTLSNSIVILDEWQNSSSKTTQLILSRLDDSCKAIIIGSNRQIDNFYLNKYNNGLTVLLKETKKEHNELKLYAIELKKAVRGKYAEFAERIFL